MLNPNFPWFKQGKNQNEVSYYCNTIPDKALSQSLDALKTGTQTFDLVSLVASDGVLICTATGAAWLINTTSCTQ